MWLKGINIPLISANEMHKKHILLTVSADHLFRTRPGTANNVKLRLAFSPSSFGPLGSLGTWLPEDAGAVLKLR